MGRPWVWQQLLIGWLPIGALFTLLILSAHPQATLPAALLISLRLIIAAAALGTLVPRVIARLPWPPRLGFRFLAAHAFWATLYAVTWLLLSSLLASIPHAYAIMRGHGMVTTGPGLGPFLIVGAWLYVMVAGVMYANAATERAGLAESAAARSQLAALRAQLHPHFLFNTLHSVVQLIPRQPDLAAQAAEELGGLLRICVEEDRELVTFADEWAFTERYLRLEQLRFGDRLRVESEVDPSVEHLLMPAFAMLTLVENAVRHGAEPRVAATTIHISGSITNGRLDLTVHDDGAGQVPEDQSGSRGTGLRRLRDRLDALYGDQAELVISSGAGGFTTSLRLPAHEDP